MIGNVIRFTLSQRAVVVLIALATALYGFFSYSKLVIDAFPDISSTQVKIIVKASGMTPAEVEQKITIPIELEMQGIPDHTIIRSVSKYALSDITIDFKEGTDIYWARDRVYQRFSSVKKELPENISGGIAPIITPLGEILMFTVESDELGLMEKRTLLDWVIRPAIRGIDGVADLNALGGEVKSFVVNVDFAKLAQYSLTLKDLQRVLNENNANYGTGRFDRGDASIIARVVGKLQNAEDIANLVVAQREGSTIYIDDVAEVKIDALTRYGYVTKDAKGEAVQGLVLGRKDADTSRTLQEVKAKLQEIEKNLSEDVKLNIFYDRSDLIRKAVDTIKKSLIEAVLLIVVVLVLLLGGFVSAFSVAVILPMAILSTFIFMDIFSISANLMSLGGIAVAIGIIVDSAVVMVENIVVRLSRFQKDQKKRKEIILQAAKEVALPIASGIIIIITIFSPLLMLQGLEGKLFAPVALSIVFTLGASLLLALFFIPVIADMFIKKPKEELTWIVQKLQNIYIPTLKRAFRHEKSIYLFLLLLVPVTFFLFEKIGKIFMPAMDEGNIVIMVESDPSINIPAGIALNTRIQKKLISDVKEIKSIVSRSGSDEIGLDPMWLNDTDMFLVLHPKEQWRVQDVEWIKSKMREVLEDIGAVEYSFTQPIQMRTAEMLSGSRGDIAIKLFGDDLDNLDRLAASIADITAKIKGSKDVYRKQNEGVSYSHIFFDTKKLAKHKMSLQDAANLLQVAMMGVRSGKIYEGMRQFDIVVRADYAKNNKDLENIYITTPEGSVIAMSDIVKTQRVEGSVQIKHEHSKRFVSVQANVEGVDLESFANNLKQKVAQEIELPPGYSIEYGGEFKNQQRTMQRLSIVVPIALAIIFTVLFFTFGVMRQAFVVFATLPLALTGGISGLYFTGNYLSVPASVGFIALLGIAVLNGVVMVSYFNELQKKMSLRDAVYEGAKRRMRPVLMTALIAALGLIPMLFATGPGSEIQKPLAIVVITGLISSTLLTLIILPVLYKRVETWARKEDENDTTDTI